MKPICEGCGAELTPQEGRGRRRRFCAECIRERTRDRERTRYAADADFRDRQLAGRRDRYARNLDHEQDRSKTCCERNREGDPREAEGEKVNPETLAAAAARSEIGQELRARTERRVGGGRRQR